MQGFEHQDDINVRIVSRDVFCAAKRELDVARFFRRLIFGELRGIHFQGKHRGSRLGDQPGLLRLAATEFKHFRARQRQALLEDVAFIGNAKGARVCNTHFAGFHVVVLVVQSGADRAGSTGQGVMAPSWHAKPGGLGPLVRLTGSKKYNARNRNQPPVVPRG